MKIKRHLLPVLENHLHEPEMTLLIGPRQAGKTTLLKFLKTKLEGQGATCLFFNLDIEKDAALFAGQEVFVRYLKALAGSKRAFIFIDEIQRLTNAGLFLKGIYDRDLPYKFIITGSGSLELKEHISESLVGRKRNFFLPTVSMWEWLGYAMEGQPQEQLSTILSIDQALEEQLLQEYLTFGGYPRVLTQDRIVDKNATLQEIYQGYIERDLRDLLQLEKVNAFVVLLQLIANRTGQLINYQDLSKMTGLSTPTIKNYLWYAEKTFIIAAVTPFFRNREKEIIKSPQYYFWDLGLRNFLRGTYEDIADQGMRFQNLVFLLLQDRFKDSIAKIQFWRTQAQAEVDFVVSSGVQLLPIEVKSGKLKKTTLGRSMHSFIKKYQPKQAWIINRQLAKTVSVGDTLVHFIPWYHLPKFENHP
ncbi:MAG: ATP-binding protein [Bacteroidota bacterium]